MIRAVISILRLFRFCLCQNPQRLAKAFGIAVHRNLLQALGVPKSAVKLASGATSRLKQIAVDGDPKRLGEALRVLTQAKAKRSKD